MFTISALTVSSLADVLCISTVFWCCENSGSNGVVAELETFQFSDSKGTPSHKGISGLNISFYQDIVTWGGGRKTFPNDFVLCDNSVWALSPAMLLVEPALDPQHPFEADCFEALSLQSVLYRGLYSLWPFPLNVIISGLKECTNVTGSL